MAIEVYSTDTDLQKIRPNILDLGVDDWTDQHKKAFNIINRVITRRWYKTAAREYSLDYRDTLFDPELVEDGFFLDLACYKTLELAYTYLQKDNKEPDAFERQAEHFRDLYNEELKEILAMGVSYDWDNSGAVVDEEKYQRFPRRLTRV